MHRNHTQTHMQTMHKHTGLSISNVDAALFRPWDRQHGKRSPMGSTRSVLTFTNPNYNGADAGQVAAAGAAAAAAAEAACNRSGGTTAAAAASGRTTIWKRLKYDKAQVSVKKPSTMRQQKPRNESN